MEKIRLEYIRQKLSIHNHTAIPSNGIRQACVMVTIVKKDDDLYLLLTKRSDKVEHHKGQISFPGGMVDDNDESANATALRELEEEIGMSKSNIEILGRLDDFHIPTGFIVTPIVGYVDCLSELKTSEDEVAEVMLIPLEKFFDPSLFRTGTKELLGKQRQIYFYDVWKEPVWGATAHIIKQFTDLISSK